MTEMPEIITGRTEVVVKKRTEENGRDKVTTIHKGIVIQQTNGGWVRVYNPLLGGDTSPEAAEWFPLQSRPCWCEVTSHRDTSRAYRIPASLRY